MTCDNCSNCDLPSVIRQPDQPPPRGLASEMLGCSRSSHAVGSSAVASFLAWLKPTATRLSEG
jgi:hypothetical protein